MLVVWCGNLGALGTAVPVAAGLVVTVVITVLFERWVDHPATLLSRRIRLFEGRRKAAELPAPGMTEVVPS